MPQPAYHECITLTDLFNMHLTVLDDDPGEYIEPGRERISVYLNGVEVKHIFS